MNNIPEPDANLIIHNIWLGNQFVSQDTNFVRDNNIATIINITDVVPNKFNFIEYINFPIKDTAACDTNLLPQMEFIIDLLHQLIIDNKSVLVHCKRGHHRSASIIAFYLMKYHDMTLSDAITFIKTIRPLSFRRTTCMIRNLVLVDNFYAM